MHGCPPHCPWALIKTDFYLLPLRGCDAGLGALWLRTLRPILWEFSNLWIKFARNGTPYHFKGERALDPLVTDNGNIKGTIRKQKGAMRPQLLSLATCLMIPKAFHRRVFMITTFL